jgi:hypothetical protein
MILYYLAKGCIDNDLIQLAENENEELLKVAGRDIEIESQIDR